MALTVDEATKMVEVAKAAGVCLYVAENASYTPKARFLREVARSGEHVGEVVAATVAAGFRGVPFGYPGRREWLARPDIGGTGTWMLHGIHTVAQLRFVFGEVETVYMAEHKARSFGRSDIEGTMHGFLTMERGFSVSVLQTCEVRLKEDLSRYVIHGDHGSVWAWDEGCRVYGSGQGDAPGYLEYPSNGFSDYALEMAAFAEYVNHGVEGPTTGRSERRSLAVVQAGYESMRSGEPVDIRKRFGDI
jgi:predicted dehydrogenase